jgi:hypothetical protein
MSEKPRTPPVNLSGVLDDIEDRIENDPTPESLTIGEILDSVGRRTYGPMLLVIGLFAISPATIVPGFTWLAAALTLVVAGQMALGLKRVWLPARALSAEAPRDQVRKGVAAARPWARRIDSVLKPRLTFLTAPPFVNLVGVLCVAAALVTFPLGLIPFAPLAPGVAVVFFGLGVTARDGLWILAGAAACAGAAWLAKPLFF